MTADGELYIDEICADEFRDELDGVFGKGNWVLDSGVFSDFWDMTNFPEEVEVSVLDKEDNEIGVAFILSEAFINNDGFNRWVDVKPINIKIVKSTIAKNRTNEV